jgi:hypothetical protein
MVSTDAHVIAACSFCLKPNTEVDRLVAGPGVYICNECVALCTQVLGTTPKGSVPYLAPWEHVTDLDGALANLPLVATAGAQADAALRGWVGQARSLGGTWARIGDSLGISRQSAWERFAPDD